MNGRGCCIPSLVSTAEDIHINKTVNVVPFFNIKWQLLSGWWVHRFLEQIVFLFLFFWPCSDKEALFDKCLHCTWEVRNNLHRFILNIMHWIIQSESKEWLSFHSPPLNHLVVPSCTFNPPICSDCTKEDQSWSDSSGEVKWVNEELIGTMLYACSFFWRHVAETLTAVINSLCIGHMVPWNTHFFKVLHLWTLTCWAEEAPAEMCCAWKSQLSHLSVWWSST